MAEPSHSVTTQDKGNSTAAETPTNAPKESTKPTQTNATRPESDTATAESQSSAAKTPIIPTDKTTDSPKSSSAPANVSSKTPEEKRNTTTTHVADTKGSSSKPQKGNSGDTAPKISDRTDIAYIAVIGPTGTGKTTFVNQATDAGLTVGHGLDSCTQKVDIGEVIINKRKVIIIDTPGFDDGSRTDTEILEIIGYFLKNLHPMISLTGVIYFRKISDNRMQRSAVANLRVLERLCGKQNYGNIVLATTHWSGVQWDEGVRREDELRAERFWGEFLNNGATMLRHLGGTESAISIVKHLVEKPPVVLQFQRELALHGIVAKTSAGQQLLENLAKEAEENRVKINLLQERNETLEDEVRSLQSQVTKLEKRMGNLDIPLDDRIEKSSILQGAQEDIAPAGRLFGCISQ